MGQRAPSYPRGLVTPREICYSAPDFETALVSVDGFEFDFVSVDGFDSATELEVGAGTASEDADSAGVDDSAPVAATLRVVDETALESLR